MNYKDYCLHLWAVFTHKLMSATCKLNSMRYTPRTDTLMADVELTDHAVKSCLLGARDFPGTVAEFGFGFNNFCNSLF